MKRLLIIIGLILLGTQALWAIFTVDGYAYLDGQSNHSGINVAFERTAPDSWNGSTSTNSSGYYTIEVDFGGYDITYTKDGYFYEVVTDKFINTNMTLDDVTLIEHPTLINVPALFSTIQEAINKSSNCDTILVQPGTYTENVNFNGKNITVASLYYTTMDENYISTTIIDGNQNGSVVRFENGENLTAELSGFTITNGYASDGGGIYCNSSSPTLSNLVINNNSVYWWGGGIHCTHSNPILDNITISSNSADAGGGIYFLSSSPTFESITVTNNSVATHGGGITLNNSNFDLVNSSITNNNGGMGGGISCFQSNLTLENVIIKNNAVYWSTGSLGCGGGIYFFDSSNINLRNVIITDNSANGLGGGILCHESYPVITNTTLSGNYANDGGGIYCRENSSPSINNSIVANNTGNYGIYVDSGNPTIKYSDFWNNESGNFYGCSAWIGVNVMTNFNGDDCDMYYNIQMDPCFVNPDSLDFHLTENSPCINAGDPSSPLDPDGTIADMGAYYFEGTMSIYPTELDFQNVFIGDDSTLSVTLKNYSDSIITIYDVFCSDTVFTTNWSEPTIPAGDSLVIDVTFTPHTTGNKTGTLTIENSYINKNVSLSGNGLGAYILPDFYALNFGAIEPGYPDTLLLEISNDGNINLTIQNIIGAPTNYFNFISITDSTILPDNSSILQIEFDPQVEGLFSDTLFIVSNAYNEDTLAINLSGEGGLTPAPVENLTINVDSVNASLNWDEVTTTIHGNPLVVDCYLVYYCGTPDSVFYFLGYTTDLNYTHNGVSFFDNQMFYQITAYVGDMPTLMDIITKHPDITLGDLDGLVESKKNYFRIMK